jgi:acyl-CoA thioesterase FadM
MGTALRAPKVTPLDTVTITLPVSRTDVEATRMNNGRYLTLMDLGRFALTARCGLVPVLVKRRWSPLVTGVMIHFRRSLRVGSTFDLSTRIVCWDEKSFFLEQRFAQGGELRAHALVKAVFKGDKGILDSAEVIASGGFATTSPAMPEAVRAWQAAEGAARAIAE